MNSKVNSKVNYRSVRSLQRSGQPHPSWRRVFTGVCFGWLIAVLGLAQTPDTVATLPEIQEEELATPELEVPTASAAWIDLRELAALFDRADTVLRTPDPASALPLFGQLLEILEPELSSGRDEIRPLLARTLLKRAQSSLELGDLDHAAVDLERIFAVLPEFELTSEAVPEPLSELFTRLRSQKVGELAVTADPQDTVLRISGRRIQQPTGKIPTLAGKITVEAVRPGFAPQMREVQVIAGKSTPLTVQLERQSAVVWVQTRPAGAEVWLDGTLRGTTSGQATAPSLSQELATIQPDQGFSEPLVIEPVELGLRQLEIRKPGFRPYRHELRIDELLDYPMPPVVLEEQRGVLVLRGMPAQVAIAINGVARRPDDPSAPVPRITLPPGNYDVRIAQGNTKMFATELRLADRQTIEVNVHLRPGLALLGVLGGDGERTANLQQSLELVLAESGKWALLDHSSIAAPLLTELGLDAQVLRNSRGSSQDPKIDWAAVQKATSTRLPGLIYVLAVLADDLLAAEADLWIWAASPGPREPDRIRVQVSELKDFNQLKTAFNQPLSWRRPWVGALLVDSDTPHPTVVDVTPGSPAAAAGLAAGDQIVAVSQVPVLRSADYEGRLAAAEVGEALEFAVQSPGGPRTVLVQLETSPLAWPELAPGELRAVRYTDLRLAEETAKDDTLWLLQLNSALILMQAGEWEEAVRRLQGIRAPKVDQGFGQPAVDYWLGVALLALGPNFEAPAAAAFTRAAAAPGARLFHHDGPWLAPRARIRLSGLQP